MTLVELESAYNALVVRIEQIERLVRNAVSTRQLNEVSLVLENSLNTVRADVTTLQSQVGVLESTVAEIV